MPDIVVKRGTYGTVIDGHVLQEVPGGNYGTDNTMQILDGFGTLHYSLIKFDPISIPAGATLTGAVLTMFCDGTITADCIATAYRILPANNGWTETGYTWNYKEQSTSTSWAGGSNGCGVSGTDISSTPMFSGAQVNGQNDMDLDLSEFTTMIYSNAGILLKSSSPADSYVEYFTSNHPDDSAIPYLTISYTLPVVTTSIVTISPATGDLAGGNTVVITGTNLDSLLGDCEVRFGNYSSPGLVMTSTTISCIAPRGLGVGAVTVSVYSGGELVGELINAYLYTNVNGNKALMMGHDISAYIIDWGKIEQVKEILLSRTTFFTAENELQVLNYNNFLSPFNSMLGGINWYGSTLDIYSDGYFVYSGIITDVKTNISAGTATICTENILRKAVESIYTGFGTSINPASAMLGILQSAVDTDYIDVDSFGAAAGASSVAGATIEYNFEAGDNQTVLQAVQSISDLSSISVFVNNNKITARAFIPYTGNESNLKQEITNTIVRDWSDFHWDKSNFNNKVSVGYGVSLYYTTQDSDSIRDNGITREVSFSPGDKVVSTNLVSATYFGNLYLSRAAKRKSLLALATGPELKDAVIGDRYPVTNTVLGLDNYPMEVIEIQRNLNISDREISLVSLQ